MIRILKAALFVVALLAVLMPSAFAQAQVDTSEPGAPPPTVERPDSPARVVLPATPVAPFASFDGAVSVSVDAIGTNSTSSPSSASNFVEIEKPAGATVRAAYAIIASTGFQRYEPMDGDVSIEGQPVTLDPARTIRSSISSTNAWADVTDLVKPFVDAAGAGVVEVSVEERQAITRLIDGVIVAVVFDDPNVTGPASVILAYGTDNFTTDVIKIDRPDGVPIGDISVELGVGISYGFQATRQTNFIDVNGERMTSSAGGQDDGQGQNGALITVGGTGDSPTNPSDPFATGNRSGCPRCDDELYTLSPFLSDVVTPTLSLSTTNPSNDDQLLFAVLSVAGATAMWDSTAPPTPLCDGLTATIDMNSNGGKGGGTDGDDVILGTPGPDIIWGNGGNDIICGFGGNDLIYGGPGDDTILGGIGNDRIFGRQGSDMIFGGTGADILWGDRDRDVIVGGDGDDIIRGNQDQDLLFGGEGGDLIVGGRGNDQLEGEAGDDELEGGIGLDTLVGGDGFDSCTGGPGIDILEITCDNPIDPDIFP